MAKLALTCVRGCSRSIVIASIALAGCGAVDPAGPSESIALQRRAIGGDGNGNGVPPDTSAPVCKHITVTGTAMYNDQRTYGRFQIRDDRAGKSGVQYKNATGALYSDGRPDNLLA